MEEIFHPNSTHTLRNTGEQKLPGREITLSRLPPYVTMVQQIMLHA